MGAPVITEDLARQMAEMREAGKTLRQIVRHVGRCGVAIKESTVDYHCLKLGALPPKARRNPAVTKRPYSRAGVVVRPFRPEEDALIVDRRADGWTWRRIGEQLGRKPHSIGMRLMTLGRRDIQEDL